MKLKDKIESGLTVLKVTLLKQKIPLAVRLQLTNRCDHHCLYCHIWDTSGTEMPTEKVFKVLDELKKMGTKTISFSGGEPMLREDLGKIIDYCKNLGISSSINSRGATVEKRVNELKNLDQIKVSLDGPEEVHDIMSRKKGAYQQSIKTVETALAHGIKTILTTTITKYNVNVLEHVLNIAEKYKILVAFQPLKCLYRGVDRMEDIYPSQEEYQRAVEKLIFWKKQNRPLRNSMLGLEHIRHWPNYGGRLKCSAGKLFCIIETNGDVYPCDRIKYNVPLPNCLELGFRKSFDSLPPIICDGCGFCGTLELNFLMSLKLNIVSTILKVFD